MNARRVAYLVGEYPAISHTFVLREVAALRQLGADVLTCSVRKTGPEQHLGDAEKQEAAHTFNILENARSPITLIRANIWALRKPRRYFSALRKAWKLRAPGLRSAFYQIFYFVEAVVLGHHLTQVKATHIHNHFAQASCTVALLASKISGIPFSFTLHGPADFNDPNLWRLGDKVAAAQFVSCISNYCRSQAMLVSPVSDWEKLHIVHCGVDPDAYQANEPDGKSLLFVGRMTAAKGVPILIKAMAGLVKDHPDCKLIIIGDGPERQAFEAEVRHHKLDNNITFVGSKSQAEVADALQKSYAFVLPSFAEGVPVVLMEAMASQKPVVATRITGIPELITDGEHGFLAPAGDEKAFEAAISALLTDPKKAQIMGAAGRQKIVDDFSIETEAAKLLELFNRDPQQVDT